jgi:hypothetical protein
VQLTVEGNVASWGAGQEVMCPFYRQKKGGGAKRRLGGLAHGRVGCCVRCTCALQKSRRGWQRPAVREADTVLRGLSKRCGGDVLQRWPRGSRRVTSGMGVDSLRSDLGDSSALGVYAADGDSVECVPVSGERRASRW